MPFGGGTPGPGSSAMWRDRVAVRVLGGLLAVGSVLFTHAAAAQVWTEDSFADFADGTLDCSGQNLYVSRDGAVRTIQRFDLNADGRVDLVFNNTHDTYAYIDASAAIQDGSAGLIQKPLAVDGSRQAALGDLNQDGYTDVVMIPCVSGIQNTGRGFTTICWGGPDGWPAARSNGVLPVNNAKQVALADVDHDGWLDIAVLNGDGWLHGQPQGRILRLFWGGPSGFRLDRFRDLGLPGTSAMCSGDVDGDGFADLILLGGAQTVQVMKHIPRDSAEAVSSTLKIATAGLVCLAAGDLDGDRRADIVCGTNTGDVYVVTAAAAPEPKVRKITCANATQVSLGDLDGDACPDIVLTDFAVARAAGGEVTGSARERGAPVRVLWSDKGDYSADRCSTLDVAQACETALGDLNGDGCDDLAISVFQGATSYAAMSPIYLGSKDRQLRQGSEIATSGAEGAAVAPARAKSPAIAVFCNTQGGSLYERVPVEVYFGRKDGFSVASHLSIPNVSGYEASAADLNNDGYVDLLIVNSMHAGAGPASKESAGGVCIYWGSTQSLDSGKPTVLTGRNTWMTQVADVNRDGYLDIVAGEFLAGRHVESGIMIWHGSADGYADDRHQRIVQKGGTSPVLADVDRDGWLDIVSPSPGEQKIFIFRGGSAGFEETPSAALEAYNCVEVEVADLNRDGWLDLIADCYDDPIANTNDTGTTIYWGSAGGFRPENSQHLASFTTVGITVADFDRDGWLDVFLPSYHGTGSREAVPCFLYWGSPAGYSRRTRTALMGNSVSDALAADFNDDGRLDLALSCHSLDGGHPNATFVYYNDGNRFSDPRRQALPIRGGSHWMYMQDMGRQSDRAWLQSYASSVYELDGPKTSARLDCTATVPRGSRLEFALRTAPTRAALETAEWQTRRGSKFTLGAADRTVQYRATFSSPNGDRYPVLDAVRVRFASR
jgi:hypothetical protein